MSDYTAPSRSAQGTSQLPAASQKIVRTPLQLVHEHLWIDHNSLVRYVGHYERMFLGYKKDAAITPSGLTKLQDMWFV